MKNKKPLLIGYVSDRGIEQVTAHDAKALDIVNIAFGHVEGGLCTWHEGERAEAGLHQLRELNPELRLVLSVGGMEAGGFSQAASTQESRERFAQSAIDLILRYGLDGIDIDWEYPGISRSGIDSNPQDKANFTLFLRAIREALDAKGDYLLTIAGGGGAYFCRNTQMDQVSRICDYIQVMTYDFRGQASHSTGHHTNLFTPQRDFHEMSVKTAVEAYIAAGVHREKIVIGAAFYSRMWQGVPNIDQGYNQVAKTVGDYGPSYDELVQNYIGPEGQGIHGFIRYWDESAKAPWLYDGDKFITYDDAESIRAKVRYLKQEGLLGMMFWEYSLAVKHGLTQVIRKAMG